jgi:hypothetical protein
MSVLPLSAIFFLNILEHFRQCGIFGVFIVYSREDHG